MSASDHLGPQFLLHGTSHEFSPGDVIAPGQRGAFSSPYAHATADRETADYYADESRKHRNRSHGLAIYKPHVYQVEPLGDHEPDDWEHDDPTAVRSKQGFRVIGPHIP